MKNKKIEEGRGADFWQNLALVGLVGIVMTFMGFFWNVYSELGELKKEVGEFQVTVNSEVAGLRLELERLKNPRETRSTSENRHLRTATSLAEPQVRREISEALQEDDVEKAIQRLRSLSRREAFSEEFWHVFRYCLKSGDFETADRMIEFLESDAEKAKARELIEIERVSK
ncbi:MAG TPA: hypothetical protein VLU25_04760 [Acidobacteriota bacterium]|nr:hypothetical protein [Acidobacteriota bacterium]